MTLSYPRDMITPYCWSVADFRLQEALEVSRTPVTTQVRELRDPSWRAVFESAPMSRAAARSLHAAFQNLGPRTFLATPYWQREPAAHDGTTFTGALQAVVAARDIVAIEDLPLGYTLTAGDFVSVEYDTGKHSLHQIAITASDDNDDGLISFLDIRPPLHPEATVGDPMRLLTPLCEMILVPETLALERAGERFRVVRFEAEAARS